MSQDLYYGGQRIGEISDDTAEELGSRLFDVLDEGFGIVPVETTAGFVQLLVTRSIPIAFGIPKRGAGRMGNAFPVLLVGSTEAVDVRRVERS